MSTPTNKQTKNKSSDKNSKDTKQNDKKEMSVQILLQSRTSAQPLCPDKISMTAKDMKILDIKAGIIYVYLCTYS
jgi:hypothetical protein